MSQELKQFIKLAMLRLENIIQDVAKSQGNTAEVEKLRMIVELAREQVQDDENSRP